MEQNGCVDTYVCMYILYVHRYGVWNLYIHICGVREQKENGTEAAIKVEKI